MIRGVDINKYGCYEGFRWPKGDDKFKFKKLNILYGYNYSGKTTLSRIFNSLETRQIHPDYEEGSFTFHLEDDNFIESSDLEQIDQSYAVRVFNSDYIRKNLSWLHNKEGSIKPFTVLGEENVELKRNIEKMEHILGNEEKEFGLKYELSKTCKQKETVDEKLQKLEKRLDKSLTDFASEVRGNQVLYNRNPYTKIHLKEDIKILEESEKPKELNRDFLIIQIKEDSLPSLSYKVLDYDKFKKIINDSKEIIKKKINISTPIHDLIEDELLNNWVYKGMEIHKSSGTKRCKFCDSPISDERWELLKNHFNKESEKLIIELDDLIKICNGILEEIENQVLFKKSDFYMEFQDSYFQILANWNKTKASIGKKIKELLRVMEDKKYKVTHVMNVDFDIETFDSMRDLDYSIKELIQDNNIKTDSLDKDRKSLQKMILYLDTTNFLKEIEYSSMKSRLEEFQIESGEYTEKINDIEDKVREVEIELEDLRKRGKDESRGAVRINDYLESYFGSDEIKLEPEGEDRITNYSIRRFGQPANNLSEGECSLIAFCYFVSQIEDLLVEIKYENDRRRNPIVYIDDPISSLDNNHIFFIFSLIEKKIAKKEKLHQLFISTHNLDFLKYLRRLSIEEKNYFTIYKTKNSESSKSKISLMEPHLRDFTTEFNYLFSEMYNIFKETKGDKSKKIEHSYTRFYSIPNNIRKFLELYTFYKYPNNDNLKTKLDLMFDDNVPDKINRIVNEFSHLTYIERAWKPLDVPEIEECIKIIFDKIEEMDPQQFEVLCNSCK